MRSLKKFYMCFACLAGIFMVGITFAVVWENFHYGRYTSPWPYTFLFINTFLFISIYFVNLPAKRKIQKLVTAFDNGNFKSTHALELKLISAGKYVGIDEQSGKMLFISLYDKIKKTVTIKEWRGYECRGNVIAFKFNDVHCPVFKAELQNESLAMDYCYKLDVLCSPSYERPMSDEERRRILRRNVEIFEQMKKEDSQLKPA